MRQTAEITLIENSTAGNPPKTFAAQSVEIRHEADTVVRDLDGVTSVAHHPSLIFWRGGTAAHLLHITHVRITDGNGELLLDGELNTTFTIPTDENGGVKFAVLARE